VKDALHGMDGHSRHYLSTLIPVLVTGIQCAQVLGRERLFPLVVLVHSRRGRAVAGFLWQAQEWGRVGRRPNPILRWYANPLLLVLFW